MPLVVGAAKWFQLESIFSNVSLSTVNFLLICKYISLQLKFRTMTDIKIRESDFLLIKAQG